LAFISQPANKAPRTTIHGIAAASRMAPVGAGKRIAAVDGVAGLVLARIANT
jgi:hypothetical protein